MCNGTQDRKVAYVRTCRAGPGLAIALPAFGQSAESLIRIVIQNVGPSGDIVKRFEAQKQLVRLGTENRRLVVPLILAELEKPHGYDNTVLQQRIALIETLRDIGPPAEAAAPTLIAILEDQDRRLEWVHFAINMALAAIGTPEGEDARYAETLRKLDDWRSKASSKEVVDAVDWHDFLIRKQLRHHRLDEGLVEASVLPLLVLGQDAGSAAPTLVRAYGDSRIGAELRALIERTLAEMGVPNPAAASAALPPPPDPLEEVIADVRSDDAQITGFAIRELPSFAPGDRTVDVLIELLRNEKSLGAVANALAEIGQPAARALPDLLPHMIDPRHGANVIQAVEKIGGDDPAALAALRAVLADPTSPHRGLAASARCRRARPCRS